MMDVSAVYSILNWIESLLLAITILFTGKFIILKSSNIVSKNYLEDKNIGYMKDLFKVHKKLFNSKGCSYSIKGFSLEKNTFSFKNIGTRTSLEGNCFGFVFLTSEVFNNTIKRVCKDRDYVVYDLSFIDKDLSKYKLDDELALEMNADDDNLNSNNQNLIYQKPALLYEKNRIKFHKPEDIFKVIYSYYDMITKYKESKKGEEVTHILKAIEYYQMKFDNEQKKFKLISSLPSVYKAKNDAVVFNVTYFFPFLDRRCRLKTTKKIKDVILNRLQRDNLVILGIYSPSFSGHGVLAYKYEKIDEDTIKIYVYDCNLPLLKEPAEEERKINDDIKNNTYILFKNINHKWQFIYSPRINGNYLYNGVLNSYVPNTRIVVINSPKKY